MAVLLLIFLYQYRGIEGWLARFTSVTLLLGGSLALLRLIPEAALESWYFQAGLFLGDAAAASLILHWTTSDSDLYLIYFLIIFGTALMRNLFQSLLVALATSGLYLMSSWHQGPPHDVAFWVRMLFLWVSSALLAILSRDSRQAQNEAEGRHQARLVQFERLATLGQLSAEVAHRIKGPLTTIMVNAEVLMQRGGFPPQEQRELAEIRGEVGRCRDILKGLLDLGRIEEMDVVDFDLRGPLRRALASLEACRRHRRIRIETSIPEEPLPASGDPALVQEAVAAVLHNAVDAVRDGGRIQVAASIARGGFGWLAWPARRQFCEISVSDDGRGINPDDLERIFQPFFTTKGELGSGLGLSAALRIMQKHGGAIEARSGGPGQGARFILSLPRRASGRRG